MYTLSDVSPFQVPTDVRLFKHMLMKKLLKLYTIPFTVNSYYMRALVWQLVRVYALRFRCHILSECYNTFTSTHKHTHKHIHYGRGLACLRTCARCVSKVETPTMTSQCASMQPSLLGRAHEQNSRARATRSQWAKRARRLHKKYRFYS